jgi:hypothetical protein
MAWIRRRQERRVARRAARMLVALDGLAGNRAKPRNVLHASLGGTR